MAWRVMLDACLMPKAQGSRLKANKGLGGRPGLVLVIGILTGHHNVSWKSRRFDRPTIPRFHNPTSTIPKDLIFLQKHSRFNRIDLRFMDFRISKIYQDSTIVNFRFYLKRSETPIVLDPHIIIQFWCPPGLSKFSKHWPSGLSYWSQITKIPFHVFL